MAMVEDILTRLAAVPAERTALVEGERTLTFGELRAAAGRVARQLTGHGVGVDSVVALRLPRGVDFVVGMLGVLTAGAAYLPVDPGLPEHRQRQLLDSGGAALLVDDGRGEPLTDAVARLALGSLTAPGTVQPAVATPPAALAYVIFTSGSTGEPKGVAVSRDAVSALLAALEEAGLFGTVAGRVGWNASAAFDASVQQWVRLCRGDTVVVLDEATRADPVLMADLVRTAALTDLDLTPSHADLFLEHVVPRPATGPLTLLVGGEPIRPALWRRISELVAAGAVRAVNLYGPTECTVDATAGWIDPGDGPPHIGSALPGLRVLLLDEFLDPVDGADAGEIYLAGPRLARGYRGRPGLTAGRFVADPTGPGERMYRTGDRARWRDDGRLEYLGRRDDQVKVRGHRIELGEVASAVSGHPGVVEAAVVLSEDSATGPALVAYYRAGAAVTPDELHDHVSRHLPGYMMPAAFVELERLPLTANGKLDRAALPDWPAAGGKGALSGQVEYLIAEVWADVIGASSVGAEDNFFKLGGHSLLAIRLVSRVRAELRVQLPLKAVYEHPRLRDLAGHIESLADVAR